MKHLAIFVSLMWGAVCTAAPSDTIVSHSTCELVPEGKAIYIPRDLRENNWESDTAQWSFHRMACTENVAVFWEKGFGSDLSKAPDLNGHKMTVDLQNLLARLEYYYQTYRDQYKFILPGSNADRLRMMVMLNYSLEGTAYGGCYDDVIGALWIAPNRVQDKKLNCIAHELGHSFQIQIAADGKGHGMGGGIYEMCSQWMLWQVNPEWTTDENYHWEAFRKLFHKRFLDGENIYHSPYVLEWWSTLHGTTVMANIFREGRRDEDPAQTYMRLYNLSLEEMGDEMLWCYMRLLTFDFPRVRESHKKYACQLLTPYVQIESKKGVGMKPKQNYLPETFGFNVIPLPNDGKKHTIKFNGTGDKNKDNFHIGVVWVSANGEPTYVHTESAFKTSATYFHPYEEGSKMYLVVVGCPKDEYEPYTFRSYRKGEKNEPRTYPYEIVVK